MSVDREFPAEFNSTVFDERAALSPLAETRGFQLQNQLAGKAIVDFGEIHVAGCYPSHSEAARRAIVQAHFEDIIAIGQVMRWVRMARSCPHNVNWLAA